MAGPVRHRHHARRARDLGGRGALGRPVAHGVPDRRAAPAARQADRAGASRRARRARRAGLPDPGRHPVPRRRGGRVPALRSRRGLRRPGGGGRCRRSVVPARRARPRGVRAHPGRRSADGHGHLPGDRVGSARAVNAAANRPGGDLPLAAGPGLPDGLTIAAADLVERFSRSPGPGGQSVNTSDSRVELEYDVMGSASLTEPQRRRALRNLDGRLVRGRLVVVASEHRSQHRNRVAARERRAARGSPPGGARTAPATSTRDQADRRLPSPTPEGQEAARPGEAAPRSGPRRLSQVRASAANSSSLRRVYSTIR
ncbi:Class I peptide chain release factor (modular protein) [metagenome]|uniref:Class I peptide chain release factor (Modular protein) n=1 Tax=metagenome TaxID=256318 RepID=A0A2P2C4Y2_9ZZZZ